MSIVNLLAGHILIGGVVAVLAGVAFLTWEYIRLESSGRWLGYALSVRWIAISLTVISVVLMGSRFISVVSNNGGV
jgi:hypothetical protein